MFFAYTLKAPIETDEANAERTVLPLCHGIINQIGIVIPPGFYGLAHLQIFRALHQVIPYNPGGTIAGNNISLVFPEFLYLKTPPYQFEAYVWNLSDRFGHTFYVYINVLPPIAFPHLPPDWEDAIPTVTENGIITPEV